MYIIGKVDQVKGLQSGESNNGIWKKKEFIIDTHTKVPKKVCITLRGDNAENLKISPGEELKIYIDIDSREYNDRWYTEIKAWKIEPYTGSANVNQYQEEVAEI